MPGVDAPVVGQGVTVGGMAELAGAARRQRVIPGRGLRAREAGPDAMVLEVDPAALPPSPPPAQGPILARVTSASSEPWAGIPVTLYGNGAAANPTGNGLAFLADVVAGADIPSGMWLVCWPNMIQATGGSDE